MTVIASFDWSEPPNNAGASYTLLCDNTYALWPDGTPGAENDSDDDADGVPDHCDACVYPTYGDPVDEDGCTEAQTIPILPPWGLAFMFMALGAGGSAMRDERPS